MTTARTFRVFPGEGVHSAELVDLVLKLDTLGYDGVLLPTGRSCEDAWVVASSLIHATKNLKFLVAVRPGLSTPGLAVRMAATFDRLSNGRLVVGIGVGPPLKAAEAGCRASTAGRRDRTDPSW